MNILRRGVPEAEAAAEATVSRRIEVTVERETVTVLVRGQPKEGTKEGIEEPVMGDSSPESEFPQMPSFPPALRKMSQVCPARGSRSMVLLPEALPVLDLTSLQQGSDAPMSTSIVPHPANGGFKSNRFT